jgi:hypothetical protein
MFCDFVSSEIVSGFIRSFRKRVLCFSGYLWLNIRSTQFQGFTLTNGSFQVWLIFKEALSPKLHQQTASTILKPEKEIK